jgi:D-inositol-3-phosphate glycosyltransferase
MHHAVVFKELPRLLEVEKDEAPHQRSLAGGTLASADLIASFLRFGTSDQYYALISTPDEEPHYRKRLEAVPNGERIVLMPLNDWAVLRAKRQLVLFTHTSRLFEAAHIRNCVGSPQWVASSVIHTLSAHMLLAYCHYMNLQQLYAHDSLICTSTAGRTAMRKLMAMAAEGLSRNGQPIACPSFQLPLIPFGVDPERFRPRDRDNARTALGIPAKTTVFLCLGRFSSSWKMDLYPLLVAFKEAFPAERDVVLVLAGDDTAEKKSGEQLRGFAADLGLGARLRIFANPTSAQKQDLYAAADVFTSLSDNLQETFGLTILEAMASGLPVVASDWSGYRDLVVNGETGHLVPTYWSDCTDDISQLTLMRGDADTHWLLAQSVIVDVAATVAAFRALSEHPERRQEMGANGRTRVLQGFSWQSVVERYEELWNDSLQLAAAREHAMVDGIYGVNAYRYFDAFQHYSSRLINGQTTCSLTASGVTCADAGTLPRPLERDRMDLRRIIHLALLARLRQQHQIALEDLLTQTRAELALPNEVVLRHFLRLVKYGLAGVELDARHA